MGMRIFRRRFATRKRGSVGYYFGMITIACRDTGIDCDYVARAQDALRETAE